MTSSPGSPTHTSPAATLTASVYPGWIRTSSGSSSSVFRAIGTVPAGWSALASCCRSVTTYLLVEFRSTLTNNLQRAQPTLSVREQPSVLAFDFPVAQPPRTRRALTDRPRRVALVESMFATVVELLAQARRASRPCVHATFVARRRSWLLLGARSNADEVLVTCRTYGPAEGGELRL